LKLRLLSYTPASANGGLLPALLAGLLATGAVVQMVLPAPDAVPDGTVPGRAPQWTLPDVGEPGLPLTAIMPRLFTPKRLGAALLGADGQPASGSEDEEKPEPKPVGPLSGGWVLGAMRVGNARAVVIRPASGGGLRLPIGSSWRGWRLVSIGDSAATFRHGGRLRHIPFGTTSIASENDQ